MWKILKQLPKSLMILLIVSFVWSWMEPPFFAYGGYIFGRSRLLAIGVFASYYIIVIVLLILIVRQIANLTGVSFKLLFKQAFKGLGTKGLGGMSSQSAPVVEMDKSELFDVLMDMDVTISGLVTDPKTDEIDEEFMDKVRHYSKVVAKICGLELFFARFLGLEPEVAQKRIDQEYELWKQAEPGSWVGCPLKNEEEGKLE